MENLNNFCSKYQATLPVEFWINMFFTRCSQTGAQQPSVDNCSLRIMPHEHLKLVVPPLTKKAELSKNYLADSQ